MILLSCVNAFLSNKEKRLFFADECNKEPNFGPFVIIQSKKALLVVAPYL